MASEYKMYLAANILSEDKVVTYQLLSRALNVHVNTAKEMLFEFHRQQNGKKPGTVHATYLLAGNRRRQEAMIINEAGRRDGEDEHMQSSPFRSSPPQVAMGVLEDRPALSITLVREEDLEELRSQYEKITSIHVYSIGPHPLKDLQVLSDATRQVQGLYSDQDPLKVAGTYGTIVNKGVKRRTIGRPPPPVVATTAPISSSITATSRPKENDATTKQEASSSDIWSENKSTQSLKEAVGKGQIEKKSTTNEPANLKRESSNIFKSFAKAKPKLKREGTDSSAAASGLDSPALSGQEDSPMKDVSEDEEENYIPPPQASSKVDMAADRKSREERVAALKKMMEEDDPDDQSLAVSEPTGSNSSVKEVQIIQPTEQAVQISDGRRRGKRRVMKKKTIKDEEGYLVTREEAAWESFSEEEQASKQPKAPSSLLISKTEKPKKGNNKPGQGSIMSFFGKK